VASVQEGLEDDFSGDAVDPFVASLEAKLRGEEPPAVEEAPAPEAPEAPLRDPETGRFVKAESEGTPEEVEGTPEGVEEVEETLDPRIAEKDSFIGRQANEIGELRKQVEELKAQMEQAKPAEPEAPPPVQYIPEDQAELVVERLGVEGAVMAAINEGLDPESQAFKAIFSAAAENAESQAQLADLVEMRLMYRQQIEYGDDEDTSDENPALAYAESQYQDAQIAKAAEELRQRVPDWADIAPFMQTAAEKNAAYFNAEIASGDPGRITNALALLADAARGVRAVSGAATGSSTAAAREAAAANKAAAQVASGSLRPADQGTPADEPADELEKFYAEFRAAVRPSVADGLTG